MKSSLRVKFKERITSLSDKERRQQSEIITQKLAEYLNDQRGWWTLYCPLIDEPNLLALLDLCPHIQWAFPRVESPTEMSFRKVESREQMVTSSWGLDEPHPEQSSQIPLAKIAGCIIPGLAFDKHGTRLGRGGGYYDRFLPSCHGVKVGVTFNEGFATDSLPKESHDQIMNIIVSPKDWIEIKVNKEVKDG